ncbi:MAG: nitroreductase family protein [Allobaculum sp.]
MTLCEAMKQRHMVRKYTNQPIPAELVEKLNARIAQNNEAHNLNLALVTNNADGLSGFAKVWGTGVNNYIILAGPLSRKLNEKLGYCGADLILYAQTLGLNTWWIGGMFNSKGAEKHLPDASKKIRVCGVIVIGYGQAQGEPHESKSAQQVSSYNGEAPQWFKDGVEATLLAPTAQNNQMFSVRGDGNKVSLTSESGHFAGMDTGICKYHFELGAGKENFEWD